MIRRLIATVGRVDSPLTPILALAAISAGTHLLGQYVRGRQSLLRGLQADLEYVKGELDQVCGELDKRQATLATYPAREDIDPLGNGVVTRSNEPAPAFGDY